MPATVKIICGVPPVPEQEAGIFNYARQWREANRGWYDLAGVFGQFWYTFRKEHSIFDNVMYPKIYRKDYDPKIDYRKMHLSSDIRRLNN